MQEHSQTASTSSKFLAILKNSASFKTILEDASNMILNLIKHPFITAGSFLTIIISSQKLPYFAVILSVFSCIALGFLLTKKLTKNQALICLPICLTTLLSKLTFLSSLGTLIKPIGKPVFYIMNIVDALFIFIFSYLHGAALYERIKKSSKVKAALLSIPIFLGSFALLNLIKVEDSMAVTATIIQAVISLSITLFTCLSVMKSQNQELNERNEGNEDQIFNEGLGNEDQNKNVGDEELGNDSNNEKDVYGTPPSKVEDLQTDEI